MESLLPNWRLMFRSNAGIVGRVAYPFMLLFECIGPVIEVLGYSSVLILGMLACCPSKPSSYSPVRLGRARGHPAVW